MSKPDAVNPSHYKADPSGVECIQITRHRNFNIGNAIKYLWRAGLKESAPSAEDLRKAIWYLEDEIGRIEGTGAHAGQTPAEAHKRCGSVAPGNMPRTCRLPLNHDGDHDDGF
jgi:hypothetical protein